MSKLKIYCQDNEFIQLDKLEKIVQKVLKQRINLYIDLSFVSQDEIRLLNKENRAIDRVTDVLSFPMLDGIRGKVIRKKDFLLDYDEDENEAKEEDDEDIYMQYLHSVIESWVQQQDIDGGWYDIDENTAIARIEIMSRNSYMLMDSSYDSALFKAIIYYGREERKSEFEILCEEAAEILQEEIINI